MKPHKWAKEIKSWADGAEIECKHPTFVGALWEETKEPMWLDDVEYRIKPQPKEPQYLYVFDNGFDKHFTPVRFGGIIRTDNLKSTYKYIGKIKLENDDE